MPLGSITWLGSLRSHPGAPPTSGKVLRAQQPPTGLLASKWVLQKNLSTVSYPVAMTGPAGFGIWGLGRREASLEASKHGGNFRPERTKNLIPMPLASTYQETRLWGLKEPLGKPSQICSPPPPLGRIPFGPLRGRRGPLRCFRRSHFFHASREREAQ